MTVGELVDLSQTKRRKEPHIHYVALSRMRNLNTLHILNLNEDALAVDESVHIKMERLRRDACIDLCYVEKKTESSKFKVVFHNARSLHKHFCDMKF